MEPSVCQIMHKPLNMHDLSSLWWSSEVGVSALILWGMKLRDGASSTRPDSGPVPWPLGAPRTDI